MTKLAYVMVFMASSAFAMVGPMHNNTFDATTCTGNSTSLTPVDCDAWQELYDSTNGMKWSVCPNSRSDPCSCSKYALVACTDGHINKM
jgi:hypothetical protein